MIQSIYLDGRAQATRVGLLGRALEVTIGPQPPSLAPLARIRRICCWGRVDWTGEALLACAAASIPICFLSRGRGMAYLVPAKPAARSFGALIDEACLHPEWTARLENWTSAELRRSLLIGSRRIALAARMGQHSEDPKQVLRSMLRSLGPSGAHRQTWGYLSACLHAWVVERLVREPMCILKLAASSDRPNLPERLTLVLSPLMLPAAFDQVRREDAGTRRREPLNRAGVGSRGHRATLRFHNLEPHIAKHFDRCFRRFERLVRDAAEDFEQ